MLRWDVCTLSWHQWRDLPQILSIKYFPHDCGAGLGQTLSYCKTLCLQHPVNGTSRYGFQMVALQLSLNVSQHGVVSHVSCRCLFPLSSRLVDSYPLAGSGCYQALGDLGGRGGEGCWRCMAMLRISKLFWRCFENEEKLKNQKMCSQFVKFVPSFSTVFFKDLADQDEDNVKTSFTSRGTPPSFWDSRTSVSSRYAKFSYYPMV